MVFDGWPWCPNEYVHYQDWGQGTRLPARSAIWKDGAWNELEATWITLLFSRLFLEVWKIKVSGVELKGWAGSCCVVRLEGGRESFVVDRSGFRSPGGCLNVCGNRGWTPVLSPGRCSPVPCSITGFFCNHESRRESCHLRSLVAELGIFCTYWVEFATFYSRSGVKSGFG